MTISLNRICQLRAYTLVELVVSIAVMTVLVGGMGSVILIASSALPGRQSVHQNDIEAMDCLDQIAGELFYATSITEAGQNRITFTVADRGHGDPGPEAIRYEWSGTQGDLLTRQYNGGGNVKICDNVYNFSLAYSIKAARLEGSPRVLMVVVNKTDPLTLNGPRKAVMEAWGYAVQLISASDPQADFDVAVTTSDVAYISEKINAFGWGTKLRDAPIGVVNEEPDLCDEFGFSLNSTIFDDYRIVITDNNHEITSGFQIGNLDICGPPGSDQPLTMTSDPIAPRGRELADLGSGGTSLMVIEAGDELYGGGNAAGRRVKLPWGGTGFDFNSLNSNGLKIMRRAIEWGGAPVVYSGVRIVLQVGSDSARSIETETQILNAPRANGL